MKKHWKWIAIALALCVACGAWFYYEIELLLGDLLPEEQWTGVTVYDRYGDTVEKNISLDAVLEAIDSTTVDRGQEFHQIPAPFYMISLESSGGAPALIYALPDGRVSMAIAMGDYQYFENGEELYAALQALATP